MKITINKKQREFILKAINNIAVLYDFSIDRKEFKESYGLSKNEIEYISFKLKEVLK